MQPKIGDFVSLVAAGLQGLKEQSEIIEEVSGQTSKSLVSFHCSSIGRSETRQVTSLGSGLDRALPP
jgi:hypothetical protein